MAQPVLQNRSATLRHQWLNGDGEPAVPPGGLTVTVADTDGNVIVPATTTGVTEGTATTPSEYALAGTHTAALGRLTVTWTGGTDVATQLVDVVGAMFGSVAGLKAAEPTLTAGTAPKSNTELGALRDLMWHFLEDRIGYSLVPRRTKTTIEVPSERSTLELPDLRCSKITTVTEDGTTVATTDMRLSVLAGLLTRLDRPWRSGVPIVVDYLHGLPEIPHDLLAPAWTGCRVLGTTNQGAQPVGLTSWNDPATGAAYRMLVPGRFDTPTTVPELNEAIINYRLRRAI